jgi:hypothetical protein
MTIDAFDLGLIMRAVTNMKKEEYDWLIDWFDWETEIDACMSLTNTVSISYLVARYNVRAIVSLLLYYVMFYISTNKTNEMREIQLWLRLIHFQSVECHFLIILLLVNYRLVFFISLDLSSSLLYYYIVPVFSLLIYLFLHLS